MSEAMWNELTTTVMLGQTRTARIVRVDRWGLLLDLGLPFPGFMDRLNIGDEIGQYHVDDRLDVVVVQFADYNRQVRVKPLMERQPPPGPIGAA